MDQMVTTYKYRMEPSRKNVCCVGGGQLCDLRGIRPSKACGRSSWFSGNHSPSQGGGGGGWGVVVGFLVGLHSESWASGLILAVI